MTPPRYDTDALIEMLAEAIDCAAAGARIAARSYLDPVRAELRQRREDLMKADPSCHACGGPIGLGSRVTVYHEQCDQGGNQSPHGDGPRTLGEHVAQVGSKGAAASYNASGHTTESTVGTGSLRTPSTLSPADLTRLRELAREAAHYQHSSAIHDGPEDGHTDPESTCPHPDCRLVREGMSGV